MKITAHFAGSLPDDFSALRAAGNHLTYHFHVQKHHYLLRLDPGGTDDDYMIAESAVMNFLHEQGLPVPRVWEFGEDFSFVSWRWQIMDFAEVPNLNKYAKENQLELDSIAEECGRFLAQLHQFRFSGYGFLNTELLRENGSFQGLDASCSDYFGKCLLIHLNYLEDHGFFSAAEKKKTQELFRRFAYLLNFGKGSLLHRDFTFWNILGTEKKLLAVIDWDDCVIGDPMDDFGIVACFQDASFMERMISAYSERIPVMEPERIRIRMHFLRNMLWKTMIRDYMGYFNQDESFFLSWGKVSLRETTVAKLKHALEELDSCR